MENIKTRLKQLLSQSKWSFEDRNWLLDFLESEHAFLLRELLKEDFFNNLSLPSGQGDEKSREILEKIHCHIGDITPVRKIKNVNVFKWIAASIILFVSIAIFEFRFEKQTLDQQKSTAQHTSSKKDLDPGTEKAVLTLSDGSVVLLDEALAGKITQQDNVLVEKLGKGELMYRSTETTDNLAFNTISTPRGGKFQITLADGSKVWLNAASSLIFPVNFIGEERRVKLVGEAYFEIAHNKSMPFIVEVDNREDVRVYGTHFNINAYQDEPFIRTTLLEGSVAVQVKGNRQNRFLVPGQQLSLSKTGNTQISDAINVEETIAWKEDKFHFGEGMDLEQVMRQIGRWYDIEVVYMGDLSSIHLGGTISRNVSASKVFEMLEMTGVAKFTINGRKVIVEAPKK